MNLKDEELFKLTKLTSQQIEYVTCVVCCKYYIAPHTAFCGHTLCQTCWSGRLKCAYCAEPVERSTLKHNAPIQSLTEKVHALGDAFEKLFHVKVAEFMMEVEADNNSTNNVSAWLASSQNHFSNPASSDKFSQDIAQPPNPLNVSSNKIQIHTNTSKSKSPKKVVYVSNVPQDDWDKIEPMPDTENIRRDKENVVGPMDIEPFMLDDDNEYSVSNPRRSSRKRELKSSENNKNIQRDSLEKPNSKDSSEEIDKKSNKSKQYWSKVKKMRKDFSNLNKNRSKLNVSIEMCKKTQTNKKPADELPQAAICVYDIDENTPNILHGERTTKDLCTVSKDLNPNILSVSNINTNNKNNENQSTTTPSSYQRAVQGQNISNSKNDIAHKTTLSSHQESINACKDSMKPGKSKLPFYKKSSLYPKSEPFKAQENAPVVNHIKTTHNLVVDSNTCANDDIEITIKVANTIANIVIKRKHEMELKINTDQAIQTSLDTQDAEEKRKSSKNTKSQNIVVNVGETHEIQVTTQSAVNQQVDKIKTITISDKAEAEKKNTESADTATISNKFEITESVEKELSKEMDIEDVDKQTQPKSIKASKEKSVKDNSPKKTQKSVAHSDLEYLNDLDIFDSESVKESEVQLLKNSEPAPSEILLSTVKTKNKSQRLTQKRFKGTSDENNLPKAKKAKLVEEITEPKEHQPENDSMNYDVIMGTVFATIDAEIEETRQSQNIIKNTNTANVKNEFEAENNKISDSDKCIQDVDLPKTFDICNSSQIINCNNQKDSENIFSMEKDNVVAPVLESANNKMLENVPPSTMEEFLTPVISQAENHDAMNDDSDKSVVEETPQKTSFTKMKQKGSGASKESSQTPRLEEDITRKILPKSSNKTSIINLTDTSVAKSDANDLNVTAINTVDRIPAETPLTINKFVDHIQHNSTPLAKKSLNFETDVVDDLTLCATTEVAKTTQEREFMIKAFEKTPTAPVVKPQSLRSLALKHKKFVIAGSCLSVAENANLRKLCARNKWIYQDKYTKDLTHLVVGVDEQNKAQRSVKYMCALASSIWIISYRWVEKSIQSKDLISEEPFEALDNTGDPGPRRSRVASKRLFQGISFFCMEPFSILDVNALKEMIEAAGGRVVKESKDVRVTNKSSAPAILLAEPENTQEDRFIYMAMELGIVPVNFEWVLNCLGSYTLTSIHELLLCPASLLPKAISNWPQELLAREDEESPI